MDARRTVECLLALPFALLLWMSADQSAGARHALYEAEPPEVRDVLSGRPVACGAPWLLDASSTISKTAPSELAAGDPLTYTISVFDAGGTTKGVITDAVPANCEYLAGSMSYEPPEAIIDVAAPSTTQAGSIMTWTVDSSPSPLTLTFAVAPILPITDGTVLTNEAWLSGTVSAPATTTVHSSPSLHLVKTGQPAVVSGGGLLTYTLTVSNTGDGIATNVVVTDAVPAHTTFQSGSMATIPPGAATITPPVAFGPGNIMTWTLPNLADRVDLTFQVAVDRPIADGTVIANTAWLQGATAGAASTVSASPSLHLAKTGQPAVVSGGGLLTYTLTVSNTGDGIAANVVVTDAVPAHTTFQSGSMATIPPGAATITPPVAFGPGNVMTWTLPALADRVDLTFQVAVDRPIADGTVIANTAWLQGATAGAASTVSASPSLHLVKTGQPAVVSGGGLLTYTLTVSNTGDGIATNVVVTDAVPAHTTFQSGSMAAIPPGAATITPPVAFGPGNVMTWTLPALADRVDLTFQVAVDRPIADGTVIANTAWLQGATAGAASTVSASPSLHLVKTGQPAVVSGGGLLTYTLTVSNTGDGIAANVVVTDAVPAHTTFQSGSMATIPPGAATITPPVAFGPGNVMTWTLPSLADRVDLTFQVAVDRPIADGTVIANTAWLQGATAGAASTVSASPSLHLAKTAGPTTVTGGGLLTYTLSVSNTGDGIAANVVVTDAVPAHTTFQSGSMATIPPGAATITPPVAFGPGNVMTWTLPSLADRVDLTFQVAVDRPIANGTVIANTAWLQGATAGAASTVSASPSLHLVKTGQPATVTGGELLTYTLTVSNTGDGIAANVVVTDAVPAHTTFQSGSMAAIPPGAATITPPVAFGPGNVMTWTLPSLADRVDLTFQVAVDRPIANGTVIANTAWLQGATAGAASTVSASPSLHLVKTGQPATVTGGELLTYTLTVSNTGTGIATNVVVTDAVPAHTTFQSGSMAAIPPGAATITPPVAFGPGNVMTWTLPSLADRVDLTFQVAVDRPITDGLTLTNTAWLQGATAGTTSAVSAAPTLWFAKAAGPTTVTGGGLLTYTLSVTNVGAGIATNVVVTDIVPAHTTFQPGSMATIPPGAATITPPVAFGPGNVMTWTLPSLADRVDLTFRVAVDRPITDGTVIANTAWLQGATAGAASTVSASPSLHLAKTGRPTTVSGGELLTYTLTVSNTGTGIATNVVVTDAVPAHTTYQPGSMAANPPDQITLAPPAGPGRVMTWTLPSLADRVDLTFRVAVDRPIADGTVIANTAWLPGATASAASTVSAAPSLHLNTTVSPSTVHVGELLTYTVTLSNDGAGIAQGVVLTDRLPAGAVFVGMVQGESPVATTPEITWNNLTVATSHVLTFRVTAPPRSGSYFNQAAATVNGIRLETGPSAEVLVTTITRITYLPIGYKNYQCSPDLYEGASNNDSPQTAYPLASNTTLFANFCESGTKDEYKFTVSGAGVPIRATLSQIPSGCDYDLYLYSMADLNTPKATSKQSGSHNETVQYQPEPSEAGEFLLLVHAFSKCAGTGSTDYRLSVAFQ